MAIKRLDIKTWAENGFYEHNSMRGIEMKSLDDLECLVQEFFGELKTNKGEAWGIGLADYGSDLRRFIGEPLNDEIEMEIDDAITSCAEQYYEILQCNVISSIYTDEGRVEIEIELKTIYGITLEVLDLSRGC